jgi:hypothetical protein
MKAVTTRDGVVQTTHSVEADNGEIGRDLQLTAERRGRYRVTGTFQGKAHNAELTVAGGIPDDKADSRRLLKLLRARPGTQIELVGYIPSVNPSEVTTQQATRLPEGDAFPISLKIGALESKMRIDAHGRMEAGTIDFGQATATIDRVWQRGTP